MKYVVNMFDFWNESIYSANESILLASSIFPNNEQQIIEAYSELCQTYKVERFTKKVNSF